MKSRPERLKDLITHLEDLIRHETYILNDKNGYLELVENDNLDHKGLKKVTIKGIQELYLAFKLDDKNFPFLGKLLKGGDFRKAVDAVIFCRVKEKDYIFLVEMKSKETKSVSLKYKSSKLFLNFLKSTLNEFYDSDILNTFEIRSLLFDRNPISKGKDIKPRTVNSETFYHQGFGKITNETWITKFIR